MKHGKINRIMQEKNIEEVNSSKGIIESIRMKLENFIASINHESITEEFTLFIKSPWYYWYTGEKKIAVTSWGVSLLIPAIFFVIAFLTADMPLFYLLQFMMVIILDNLIWLVVGFLGLLVFSLNSIFPHAPEWISNSASESIWKIVFPLVLMGIYSFFQSRIITRMVAKFVY